MAAAFDDSARRMGNAPLLDFLGRHYSYAETLDGANRVACGLKAMGYGPGDRIGLFLPNVPHYVAAYYGILKLGATVVNFSPLYSVEELRSQVEDSGTRLLFTISATALLPTALKVLEASSLERLVVGFPMLTSFALTTAPAEISGATPRLAPAPAVSVSMSSRRVAETTTPCAVAVCGRTLRSWVRRGFRSGRSAGLSRPAAVSGDTSSLLLSASSSSSSSRKGLLKIQSSTS